MKRIGRELALEASLEASRGYLLERLKDVTPDDLFEAIQGETHTLNVSEEKDKRFGKKMARKFGKVVYERKSASEHLTADLVLEWLCEDLPRLGSLILNMGDKGMNWLREDVKKISNYLFTVEE